MIYLTLFLEFFKIGLFSFGGGFGMIPLVEETVVNHGWLSESSFYDFIGVCESTPGPIAINMATYIGSTQGGLLGSIVATLGVVLPSFIIILLIASVLKHFTENKYFKSFVKGVQPVVVGLLVSTGFIMLLKAIGVIGKSSISIDIPSVIIFLILVCIYFLYKKCFKKKLTAIQLIIISAILGIAISLISKTI